MTAKDNILEAWIMVEHLSEGDIRLRDKAILTLGDLQRDASGKADYYSLFHHEVEKKNFKPRQKGGFVVYFDIFDFQEAVTVLRTRYHLNATEEEIQTGHKFSYALYFDKELNLLEDMTFFTVSAYIRYYKEVPHEKAFREFEDNLKKQFAQDFEESAGTPEKFNAAMEKALGKFKTDMKNCRMQLLNNVETEGTNLHSFFIQDLEKAKEIDTANLRAYLYGTQAQRVNLDSKKDSAHFHPRAFEEILQPEKYPLGRFPSKTEYALSLMQQAAVNLSIGADSQPIRSVNGPPGTGKTTLLKDIFAQLTVQQAYDIAQLPQRSIKGPPEMAYFNQATIGAVPAHITENSIVVASSNNGAVQNIVNELPLCQGIDGALLAELKEADYFRKISNAKASSEWKKDENGKIRETLVLEPLEEEQFWGLYSLEGGKADHMNNILTHVKHICKYLEEEYQPAPDIYEAFLKQYEAVRALRTQAQNAADSIRACQNCARKLEQARTAYLAEGARKEKETETELEKLKSAGLACGQRLTQLQRSLEEVRSRKESANRSRDSLELCLEANKRQKPGFFAGRREKEEYKNRLNEITDQLLQLHGEDAECSRQERELRNKIIQCQRLQEGIAEKMSQLEKSFSTWKSTEKAKISRLETELQAYQAIREGSQVQPLDMEQEYEDLQLSNPWFDETYRIAQSRLFLAALRVRKQFLYENRKNLQAAAIIWNQQDKYLERKSLIEAAWNWINMAVPVISSTFASFARMCKNLRAETLGHLFIDEAGQALPQAAVGAVWRSRHVMVVGDPSQIKPVLTLDSNTLSMLGQHFGVTEKYLSASASAQTLADAASQYGFYRKQDLSEDSWIGIPLWVHRRCQYPMFTISNEISYGGFMVQGMKKNGRTGWFDIGGKANKKYVEEQGDFLVRKLQELMEKDPRIADKAEKDVVYVITPFSNAAYQLSQKLRKIHFTRYDAQNRPTNVGTVHTFQGKEAPIVFFVLGADRQSSGAARWAVGEPNIMNVAATRAKEEFYIIGDKRLYLGLGCDVADTTARIIQQYKTEHPELVEDTVPPVREEDDPALKERAAFPPKAPPSQSTPAAVPQVRSPEAPAPAAGAPSRRVTGTVSFVGKGSKSFFAYISGDDGKEYSINESMYSKTAQAAKVIQKGRRVSFIPKAGVKKPLAADVRPEGAGEPQDGR